MATEILPPPQMQMPSTSAAGIIAFLDEEDENLKISALKKLYRVVDVHWAEICDSLPDIEALSEDTSFSGAELAAGLASKCFFHLQDYNDSLRLAFSAGAYFNIHEKCEYVDILLSKCIDEYTELRLQQESEGGSSEVFIDPRMEIVIEELFKRCYRDGCYEQAMGVALDTRRIDKVREVCDNSLAASHESILGYTFNLCQGARNIPSREFRLSVIDILVEVYGTLPEPDYANVCFGLQYLDRPEGVAKTLDFLCKGSLQHALQAYQVAFDLQETENQGFVLRVIAALPIVSEENGEEYKEHRAKLERILVEGFDVDLILNFLFKQCKSDISILQSIKTATENRTAILHNSTVVCHSYMYCGTTIDAYLRDNLQWLGKAGNWSKFTAVASIGVVNKGHVHESMNLLQPYLPQGGVSASPYSEAGALYALGLIHANKGGSGDSATISYLSDSLNNAGNNEIVQHGACLGLGLAAMATGNEGIFNQLKGAVYTDSATAGEGASLAMGLLLLGQSETPLAQENIEELLNCMHDTEHEKIVRGLALSIAMMVYCKEESADPLIEQLARDRDPIVRYGAMYAVAMAYCGTGDNGAIRRLLHVAVSDVSDDVRRAAVTCLGFLLFRRHEEVPKLVSLLAESFNPHVRYGACMAVGIACAGTAFKEAIDLLHPMLEDPVDYVRQGAFMAMALVLMQISEARSPTVKKFREQLASVISDKHQSTMSKSGAILASGIMDAGGRNMVPTMLIGLNKDFNIPKNFSVKCAAPPSMFAYPKIEEKKEDKREKVVTAVLSTTVKSRAREVRKEARKSGKSLSRENSVGGLTDEHPLERVTSHLSTASYLSIEEKAAPEPEESKKKDREPGSFMLSNPDRQLPTQNRFISVVEGQRYVPVDARMVRPTGIVVLIDGDPSAPEDVATVQRVMLGQEEEAPMPEPFLWTPGDDE